MNHTFILLLLSSFFAVGQSQTDTLPKPTGEYFVGVTYLAFVDHDRKELFDNNQVKDREITVKAWYPSDMKSDFEPYLLNSESDFAIQYLQFPEIFRNLKTNSSLDVPLSSKESKYPVLIFSHGWGEHYSQNSILMEELASYGYIVYSISHHYECKFSSYPDGRFIYIDMNSQRLQKIMGEMANPVALELIQKFSSATNDEERLQLFADMEKVLPTGLSESLKCWAEDISFFIDQLDGLNSEHMIFKKNINLDKLGVFGMSLGGLASLEASLLDGRIKACLSMDGGLHGLILKSETKTPTMFLNSKRYLGYGNIFTNRSKVDCFSLTIINSDHMNFSDYSIYPYPAAQPLLGSIEGEKVIKIMNVMGLSFFDKYLKEKQTIDLTEEAKLFSEIKIVSKLK